MIDRYACIYIYIYIRACERCSLTGVDCGFLTKVQGTRPSGWSAKLRLCVAREGIALEAEHVSCPRR